MKKTFFIILIISSLSTWIKTENPINSINNNVQAGPLNLLILKQLITLVSQTLELKNDQQTKEAHNQFELRAHLNAIEQQLATIKNNNPALAAIEIDFAWSFIQKLINQIDEESQQLTTQKRAISCNAILDVVREKLIDIRHKLDQMSQTIATFIPINNSINKIILNKAGSYKLVENVTTQIVISADNIVLDLNGFMINFAGTPPLNGACAINIESDNGANPRKNIQIINGALGSGITIVRHHVDEIPNAFGLCVGENCTQIIVDGIRFRDTLNDSIHINAGSNNVIIRNVSIDDTSGNGVFIAPETSGISLQNTNFQDCQKAGIFSQGSALTVQDALFVDNRGPAIMLNGTPDSPVTDSTFKNVDIVLSNVGIQLENTNKTSFDTTTIKKTTNDGLVIGQNCPDTTFKNSEIKESGGNGIKNNSSKITVDTTIINDSGANGILTEGLNNQINSSTFNNITIKNAGETGMMVINSANNIFKNITVNEAMTSDGIFIDAQSTNMTLGKININNAARAGINIHANDTSINGGTINNADNGIEAHGETTMQEGFSVTNITINNSKNEGVRFLNTRHPSIKSTTIMNAKTGILVDQASTGAHIEDTIVAMVSTGIESMGTDVHLDSTAFHNISGSAIAIGRELQGLPTENFTINDITIQNAQVGIEAIKGTNVIVTNSRIVNTETGVMTGNDTTQVIINKTIIQNTMHNPVMIGGNSLEIKDSTIQNSGGSGITVMGTVENPINNVSLNNVNISQAANNPEMATLFGCTGVELTNVNNALVQSTKLNGIGSTAGTMMTTGIKVTNGQGIQVVGSTIQDVKSNAQVMGIALNNTTNSSIEETMITNNTSGSSSTMGIFINPQSVNTQASNNKLTHNNGNADSAGLMNESPSSVIYDNAALFNSQNIVGAPPLPPQSCCIGNIQIDTMPARELDLRKNFSNPDFPERERVLRAKSKG